MAIIQNPILKGFNPDPSIIRVKDDYFIATSTFEWFPGVQIHHSRDLINWRLIARPLNRISQLNMIGNPDSCGIWAPCLSYENGMFYLIYTDVKRSYGGIMNSSNYLVTTNDIFGDWSEPIYLNSIGFDPSLFHDEDGKKWLVGLSCGSGNGHSWFDGIVIQEYSHVEKKLVGQLTNIFNGTSLGCTEGPHLYKRNGYYYLITAEGGTGYDHAVTVARSEKIEGPYEVDPIKHILTSKGDRSLYIQKAGHADFVETTNGETYLVHLCGRPLPGTDNCVLGRETCIQKMKWTDDGWIRLEAGGNRPQVQVEVPLLPECKWEDELKRDDFDSDKLNINYQSLRIPLGEDMLTLTERPGFLRLKGKEALNSVHRQSLIARRQQAFKYTAVTCLEFEPLNFRQKAGLVCYYNTSNHYFFYVSHDKNIGKSIGIMAMDREVLTYPTNDISIEGWDRCFLKVMVDYEKLQFYYSNNGEEWTKFGKELDMSILSDDYSSVWERNIWGFTGAFVGLCCQDLFSMNKHADFDFFEYIERN